MIVCDTGPLVALSNDRDEHYFTANNFFRDLFMAGEGIVIPATVLAEVCYWLNKHGGPVVEAALLNAVADGTFQLVDLTAEDVERMAELVRQFASFPLGRHRRVSPPSEAAMIDSAALRVRSSAVGQRCA